MFSIDKSDWSKTADKFEKRLKQKGITDEHVRQLGDVLDNNFETILNLEDWNKDYSVDHDGSGSSTSASSSDDDSNVDILISSPEKWRTKLIEKYENLYDVVQKNLTNLWHSLEFELSIKNILNIKGCSLPFAGTVLGKPSSLKTVGIELFRKSKHTFYTDNFTARSFVSHSTTVSKEQLEEIDLLPKIKNKCFLTPELAPTFAAKDDDLIRVLGILTRILDGHGYESDSGAHGHMGYNERMMFAWIGAAIDIPFKVHKLLTTLGPKLYFLRVPKVESKSHEAYYEQMSNDDFTTKVDEIGQALSDYQSWFEMGPEMVKDDMFGSTLRKMPWNSEENQKEAYMHFIKLAIEGDYITIKEGESRILEFDINKVKLMDKTDFNGNPVKKVQFVVTDPEDPERREKKFELSKKHVPKIYGELKKGKTVLGIFRIGQGKQTEYHVKAIR